MERKVLPEVARLAVMSVVAAVFLSAVSPVLADGQTGIHLKSVSGNSRVSSGRFRVFPETPFG